MDWQPNPYTLALFTSALMAGAVAVYAWRRCPAPGAVPLALLALGAANWSLWYAVATGFEDLPIRILLAKAQYPGIVSVPVALLIFTLQYIGYDKWLTRRNITLLAIIPTLCLVLAWTNEFHGLIWAKIQVTVRQSVPVLDIEYGPFFWLYTTYSYLAVLIATLILLRAVFRSSYLYRRQNTTLLVGALLPWIGNFAYLSGRNPLPYLDLTPFGYSLSGLVIAWGLFRYRLLDIVPVARDKVMESMSDGVIVLDRQARVVDVNPVAQKLIGQPTAAILGQPVDQVSFGESNLAKICNGAAETQDRTFSSVKAARCDYDVHVTLLYNRRNDLTGRLIVLHDVTVRKRAEDALQSYANRLEIMREVDQAILTARSAETIAMAAVGRIRHLALCQRVLVIEITETGHLKKLAEESSGQIGMSVGVDVYREISKSLSLRKGLTVGVEDLDTHPQLSPMQQALYAEGIRSYVVVPLYIQDRLIGSLHLEADRPRAFVADHVNAAIEVAVLLAVGIQQARLYEQAQREIAERKQAQAALHQRTLELEARNAELDAFAHTVAHDLKNPLSTVMGYTSLLVDFIEDANAFTAENLLPVANQVIQGSEMMSNIIESLLLLAGVRKQKVQFEPLDMASIMVEVQHSLAGMIEEYRAEIIFPDRWPKALGYEPWGREIWTNYISNAIKYGGRPPHVEAGATVQEDGHIRFWVRDNGRGLLPDEQEHLFAPFERLSQTRTPGHGLGLSIVLRIVEKLGGQVGVESEIDQGSTFWFTLPAAD